MRPDAVAELGRRIRLFTGRAGQKDAEIPTAVEELLDFLDVEIGDDVARFDDLAKLLGTRIDKHQGLLARTLGERL